MNFIRRLYLIVATTLLLVALILVLTLPQPTLVKAQTGVPNGWAPIPLAGLTNSATSVRNSHKVQTGLLICYNPNASQVYLQMFDVATPGAVTVGVTPNKFFVPIPPTNSMGFAMALTGLQFFNGLQVAVTTSATGSGAPVSLTDCSIGIQ